MAKTAVSPMYTTKLEPYKKRLKELDDEFQTWLAHYAEISDYVCPRKGRYLLSVSSAQDNDGSKRNSKIINGTGTVAGRTATAGIQGGMTSPSRPWFRLTLPDEELLERANIKQWLHDTRQRMLAVLARSNFYGETQSVYSELVNFGTGAMLIEEDFETVVRFRTFTTGEYRLACDARGRPVVLYRRFSMTIDQMVQEFGTDNLSDVARSAYEEGKLEERITVCHAIQPRKSRNITKEDSRNMAFESLYWEDKTDSDKFLREGGYEGVPFAGPRWSKEATDVYGRSPVMECLGDIKMLQKMEELKLKAEHKNVDPPMVGSPNLIKQGGGTTVAGGFNAVLPGEQPFQPAYQVKVDPQGMGFEIQRVEERIKTFLYNDLFISILREPKTMTAREVVERSSEKLLQLGPVIEQIQSSFLDTVIFRVFSIMDRFGLIAEPPEEIQGMEMEVQYLGILAQAQKMIATTAIEQEAAFVGSLAAIQANAGQEPEVLDKFDADEAVDQHAEAMGTPPKIVRSDDLVAKIRMQKMKQREQQKLALAAVQAAETAKTMAQTPVGQEGDTALDKMLALQ